MLNLITYILFFIIDNFTYIIITLFSIIIIYSWIDFIIKRPYKDLYKYYQEYQYDNIDELIDKVKNMQGREFEEFCIWLFKQTGKYKKIYLTPSVNDEGKDIILTDKNNNKTYVECKRWRSDTSIGRQVLQKLVGAMISDNIKNGIVITTSYTHQNGWNYINKIEQNTDIKINIIGLNDIEEIIRKKDMIETSDM